MKLINSLSVSSCVLIYTSKVSALNDSEQLLSNLLNLDQLPTQQENGLGSFSLTEQQQQQQLLQQIQSSSSSSSSSYNPDEIDEETGATKADRNNVANLTPEQLGNLKEDDSIFADVAERCNNLTDVKSLSQRWEKLKCLLKQKVGPGLTWTRTITTAKGLSESEDSKDFMDNRQYTGYIQASAHDALDGLQYALDKSDENAKKQAMEQAVAEGDSDVDAAIQSVATLASRNIKATNFTDYGCWCNKVRYLQGNNAPLTNNKIRGGHVLDPIDKACQDWTKCMRCVSLHNTELYQVAEQDDLQYKNYQMKKCDWNNLNIFFGIRQSRELTCDDPLNRVRSCGYETCMCTLDLIEKITKLAGSFDPANSARSIDRNDKCGYHAVDKMPEHHEILNIDLGRTIGATDYEWGLNTDDFLISDQFKEEDTDYYSSYEDAASVSGELSYMGNPDSDNGDNYDGQRPASGSSEMERKPASVQCCGMVPSWRPFKTSNMQCCNKHLNMKSGNKDPETGEDRGFNAFWIAPENHSCQEVPSTVRERYKKKVRGQAQPTHTVV